jgi:glycosyltransferase involved in cell wall biosynthesis
MNISILIPTFNRKKLVDEAIQSALAFDDISVKEVIVSDNHSSDGTFEFLISKYGGHKKIRIVVPPSSGGPLVNWKYCLSQASGSHVHWHWSDDLLLSNFYEKARILNLQFGFNVIAAPARIQHEDGFSPIFYSQEFDKSLTKNEFLRKMFSKGRVSYSPASYILPRESVLRHFYDYLPSIGDLNPLPIAMGPDALMIAGSVLDSLDIGFLDEPVMQFRKHSGSITEQNKANFRCYFLAFAFFQKLFSLELIDLDTQKELYGEDIIKYFYPDVCFGLSQSDEHKKLKHDLAIIEKSLWMRVGKKFGLVRNSTT